WATTAPWRQPTSRERSSTADRRGTAHGTNVQYRTRLRLDYLGSMSLGRLARALLLLPLAAAAQEPVRPEAPRQSAPVVIANRTVITLRGPIAGCSAEERVRNATDRIEAALDADPYAQIAFD